MENISEYLSVRYEVPLRKKERKHQKGSRGRKMSRNGPWKFKLFLAPRNLPVNEFWKHHPEWKFILPIFFSSSAKESLCWWSNVRFWTVWPWRGLLWVAYSKTLEAFTDSESIYDSSLHIFPYANVYFRLFQFHPENSTVPDQEGACPWGKQGSHW